MDDLFTAFEHLLGFAVVVVALATLYGLTALNGLWLGKPASRPDAAAKAPGDTASRPSALPGAAIVAAAAVATLQIDEEREELIIVATAVATMLGAEHRIVSIRPRSSGWGQQGRREIHASHRIR